MSTNSMTLREWLQKWNMSSLKINLNFLEMEWSPNDADKDAAWELYVELITRVATQSQLPDEGNEVAALSSIYRLFDVTRDVIKRHGRQCESFTKIAVIVLNQKVRPFTAKWHKLSEDGQFHNEDTRKGFRDELSELQKVMRTYCQLLADMANVEDITELEAE